MRPGATSLSLSHDERYEVTREFLDIYKAALDLSPARSLGRLKNRTDEPDVAIEHHDRLEALFVGR